MFSLTRFLAVTIPPPLASDTFRAIRIAAALPLSVPFSELTDIACRYEPGGAEAVADYKFLPSACSSWPDVLQRTLVLLGAPRRVRSAGKGLVDATLELAVGAAGERICAGQDLGKDHPGDSPSGVKPVIRVG